MYKSQKSNHCSKVALISSQQSFIKASTKRPLNSYNCLLWCWVLFCKFI